MTYEHTLSRIAGALYLATFATSIPALLLKEQFLRADGPTVAATTASVLEILLTLACVGTAVALYPIGSRLNPALAIGFVTSRVLEASIIFTGVLALLTLSTMSADAADDGAANAAFVAVHDWAFLLGPGFMAPINALLLGTLLLRYRLVPRAIPLLGLIGAPILAASSLAALFGLIDQVSPLSALAAAPIALWELSVGLWLLIRGVDRAACAAVAANRVQPGSGP